MNLKTHTSRKGAALITLVLLFVTVSLLFTLGLSAPLVRDFRAARDLLQSKQSYYTAESGYEDATYRTIQGKQVDTTEVLALSGTIATTTIATTGGAKTVSALASASEMIRKVFATLQSSYGASFSFPMQVGSGGLSMQNSATVNGDVYSNGPVTARNSSRITGSLVSAGSGGSADGVETGGSVYAHTITNSSVGKNTYYYQSQTGTTVSGKSYPGSPDQGAITLPISDALITQMENAAAANGTYTSPCSISSPTTWTPRKVTCATLEIRDTLTLTGMVWLVGNLNIKNTGRLVLAPSLGSQSGGFIVDNPSNRTSSSRIILENSSTYAGSGSPGSYVTLISQNNSAELGGGTAAIQAQNSSTGAVIFYAPHGLIDMANSVSIPAVAGYKVSLANSAQVTYEALLANTTFFVGSGGVWNISGWKETE